MKVKIKKLVSESVIPTYSKVGDAGFDLTSVSRSIVEESDYGYIEYGTGLAIEIPRGFVGLIFPRSSISNYGMILSNAVGVIDSGYRSEIKFRFKHIKDSKMYEIGERVGQLIILPYPQIEFKEVDELSDSNRRFGGFGSTGT